MGLIVANPGGALAYNGASGGKIYGYNNISESGLVQVAAVNSGRVRLTFHNPGTVDIFIAPVVIQTSGSNVAFSPGNAALGGCIRVYANGGQFVIEGECQGAYQAFALTGGGTTNPLTVIDTNV
jgi:hypothetical protein